MDFSHWSDLNIVLDHIQTRYLNAKEKLNMRKLVLDLIVVLVD